MFDYNDKVKLIKKSGTIIDDISADTQPGLICIQDEKVPVEDGDILERKLPSGIIEQWVVLDPGYYGSYTGVPSYQCKVKKVSQIVQPAPQNIIYNVNGANAKVNVNSTDQSTNYVTVNPSDIFNKLIALLQENVQENTELIKLVDEMRSEQGKPGFLLKYQNFIATAVNHITLIAPFIPALTQMIS